MAMRNEQIYPFGKVRSGNCEYDAYQMPFSNLFDTLEETAKRFPDKIGLIDANREITFSGLLGEVEAMSSYLYYQVGVRKEDKVALQMINSIEFAVAFYAILKLGATVVSINTKLAEDEILYILQDSGATGIILDDCWADRDRDILNQTKVHYVISDRGQHIPGAILFQTAVRDGGELSLPATVHDDALPALIMYTSGTTGRPKGAVMTHFNMLQGLYAYAVETDMDDTESTVIAVPMFHITGLNCVLTLFVFLGGQMILMPSFNAEDVLDAMTHYRITHFHAVSTIFIMLESALREQHDLSSLHTALCGGGFISREIVERFCKAAKNCRFHPVYGMTETSGAGTYFPVHCLESEIKDSCGKIEKNCAIKVVGQKNEILPAGVSGEICMKGAFVISGYLHGVGDECIEDGWLHSGDIGYIDSNGYVFIVDRIKDMINRGGEKIYSLPVENTIMSYGQIKQVAVFAVKDSLYGEVPGAVIIPEPGEVVDVAELTTFLREHLAHYKVPKYIEIRRQMPVTANGKTKKYVLRKEFEEKYSC